MRKQRFFK